MSTEEINPEEFDAKVTIDDVELGQTIAHIDISPEPLCIPVIFIARTYMGEIPEGVMNGIKSKITSKEMFILSLELKNGKRLSTPVKVENMQTLQSKLEPSINGISIACQLFDFDYPATTQTKH